MPRPAPGDDRWTAFLAHFLFVLAAWTVFIKYLFPLAFAVAEGAPPTRWIYWDLADRARLAGLGVAGPPLLDTASGDGHGGRRDRDHHDRILAVPFRSRMVDLAHELVRQQGVRARLFRAGA